MTRDQLTAALIALGMPGAAVTEIIGELETDATFLREGVSHEGDSPMLGGVTLMLACDGQRNYGMSLK